MIHITKRNKFKKNKLAKMSDNFLKLQKDKINWYIIKKIK